MKLLLLLSIELPETEILHGKSVKRSKNMVRGFIPKAEEKGLFQKKINILHFNRRKIKEKYVILEEILLFLYIKAVWRIGSASI